MKIKKILVKDVLFSKLFMTLFFVFVLLSYCSTEFIGNEIGITIDSISVALSFLIIVLYIFNFKASNFAVFFSFFILSLLVSTILGKDGDIFHYMKIYYRIIAFVFYFDWASRLQFERLIKILYRVLSIFVFINFLTIIFFTNGLYQGEYKNNWFLGYDNTHIFIFFPTLLLALIKNKLWKMSKFDLMFVFIPITYSIYYCFSANSVVAYTIFVLYLLFKDVLNKFDIINAKTFFIIFCVLFLLIVVFRVQNIFSWLIVDILKKDLTFTNRTIIWDRLLDIVKDNWFIGFGVENPLIIAEKLGKSHFSHAHNTILDILYKGGIISVIAFLYFIYTVIQKLESKKNISIAKIISISFFCVLLMMIFEAREDVLGFYIILSIAYKIDVITLLLKEELVKDVKT